MLLMVSSTGVALGLVIVTVLSALVTPTSVLGNATETDWLINPATPLPLSETNCVPLGAFEGKLTCPVKFVAALAVKSTLTVHVSPVIPLGCSVTPEQ
jgi:hypothetical protein